MATQQYLWVLLMVLFLFPPPTIGARDLLFIPTTEESNQTDEQTAKESCDLTLSSHRSATRHASHRFSRNTPKPQEAIRSQHGWLRGLFAFLSHSSNPSELGSGIRQRC
jgi:hypothetical protein